MPKQNYNLIVFDWDGTLMDSTSAIVKSIQDAAIDLDIPIPEKKKAMHIIGLGLTEAMQVALPNLDPKDYPRLAERYRANFLKNSFQLSLFDGIRDMLDDLKKQNYLLAVATGKSRAGLDRAMDDVGLRGYFDASRCADETHSKPHPAMLLELTEQLGEPMKRTVMIGDTTHDLLMANNAGAAGIAVQYGAHSPSELQSMHPIYSADSVEELHKWLNEHA